MHITTSYLQCVNRWDTSGDQQQVKLIQEGKWRKSLNKSNKNKYQTPANQKEVYSKCPNMTQYALICSC